jgi:hypothetical protein
MSFELKDNSGSLWVNDRKEKDTHPDRTGTVKIRGQEFFISGWLKETSAGKKYLSLSFKPKMAQDHKGGTKNPPAQGFDDLDDPLPF